MRTELKNFKNYDLVFYQTFDKFARKLERSSTDLPALINGGASREELNVKTAEIRREVEAFEDEVSQTLNKVNETKNDIAI